MAKFDAKSFNERAFGKYMSAIPNVKLNKLKESRAIVADQRLRETFVNNGQTGTVYAVLPYFGLIGGDAQNYDGVSNLTPEKTDTFEQGVFTYGRMMGWTEADFSYDVTGGVDFMANVRNQINRYWNDRDQDTILSILKGIFAMASTGTGNVKTANAGFVSAHTYDISAPSTDAVTTDAMKVSATTLNSAIQQACGDNKQKFSLVICHSTVATNLEVKNVGSTGGDVSLYTTYILGEGAIGFEPVGAKVPYEMVRDAKTRGGEDTLISRKRNAVSVAGISYLKASQATNSPTNAELENGKNWSLVSNGTDCIAHKAIPIARIISRG